MTRRNFVVRHFELSPPAFELLQALMSGVPLGAALEHAQETAGDGVEHLSLNVHEWFQRWAAEGFFQSVVLPE
jgi:hypothetical protein